MGPNCLRRQRAALAELALRLASDYAYVIPAREGGVRHPERFSRSFATRLRQARAAFGDGQSLPLIRLHDLRHTHATALLLAGVHPRVVQERLGHATVSITLDTYSHVIPTMQRAVADSFATAVYGP